MVLQLFLNLPTLLLFLHTLQLLATVPQYPKLSLFLPKLLKRWLPTPLYLTKPLSRLPQASWGMLTPLQESNGAHISSPGKKKSNEDLLTDSEPPGPRVREWAGGDDKQTDRVSQNSVNTSHS